MTTLRIAGTVSIPQGILAVVVWTLRMAWLSVSSTAKGILWVVLKACAARPYYPTMLLLSAKYIVNVFRHSWKVGGKAGLWTALFLTIVHGVSMVLFAENPALAAIPTMFVVLVVLGGILQVLHTIIFTKELRHDFRILKNLR